MGMEECVIWDWVRGMWMGVEEGRSRCLQG